MKKENLEKGQKGEKLVIEQLQSKGYEVIDYTDYSKFKFKQKKGYDIEILNKDTGELDRVDIKTNSINGYVYLEAKNDAKSKLGWFWTSSADSIFHYDLNEGAIYGYSLYKMKNYVYQNDIQPSHGRYKNLIGLEVNNIPLIKEI